MQVAREIQVPLDRLSLGSGKPLRSPEGCTATAKHSAPRKSLTRLARRITIAVFGSAVTRTRILWCLPC